MNRDRLVDKYRPKNLNEIIGQPHLVGRDGIISAMVRNNSLYHSFFYGVSGIGKTSLVRAIARELDTPFIELNATTLKISQIRDIVDEYKNSLFQPIVFIDEVHRMSRTQQEVLLPYMEQNIITIIGASTSNPQYSLTSAIRSRSHIFELHPISYNSMIEFISKIIDIENINIEDSAKEYLVTSSSGDIRAMLNLLDSAISLKDKIDLDILKAIRSTPLTQGSIEKSNHYDLISAMIKSIRGSDIDASIYYLARVIKDNEPPEFIARRLSILASEDIGNANPNALNLASSTLNIVSHIGYPEAKIPLSQLVIYLASSPKSNSSYSAINRALEIVENENIENIPNSIKSNSKSYINPHNNSGYIKQKYMNKPIKIYKSSMIGFEKNLAEWVEKIKR